MRLGILKFEIASVEKSILNRKRVASSCVRLNHKAAENKRKRRNNAITVILFKTTTKSRSSVIVIMMLVMMCSRKGLKMVRRKNKSRKA